jgi:indole-3-glycerol phosphate synthase
MSGGRRLSHAISEGDGISVIASVADRASAGAAQAQGADALALVGDVDGLREAASLPILHRTAISPDDAHRVGADACLLVVERNSGAGELEEAYRAAAELGLEVVVDVRDEEELELALERIDPEVFLLSPRETGDEPQLERVLDLLPDVPAGKLAIADLAAATRDEVLALERAGFDAVVVDRTDVADLVGGPPPAV